MKKAEMLETVKNNIKEMGIILKNNLRWILFSIGMVIFLEITEKIFQNEITIFDNWVYETISKFISNPLTYVMKCITSMASAIWIIGVSAVLSILPKTKKYRVYIIINLVLIVGINFVLKNVFDRPRPEGFRLISETGYSFPSGHSMVSMAFYGLMIYLVYQKVKNPFIKWGTCIALFILIVAIGISRIYLGVHYASDVIGGFCLSIAYLSVYTHFISNKAYNRKENL